MDVLLISTVIVSEAFVRVHVEEATSPEAEGLRKESLSRKKANRLECKFEKERKEGKGGQKIEGQYVVRL